MAPRNRRLKPQRAPQSAVWVNKEGFVQQVRSLSDIHLLHVYMMVLSNVRSVMRPQTLGCAKHASFAIAIEEEAHSVFPHVVAELRWRGLINKLPSSF